jgi:hypothetical protein
MKKIFISLALLCSYSYASVMQQTKGEWRPKGAVSIPKAAYAFMGSTMPDKDKATLWTVMGSFMVHPKKNKWTKVRPECTDELVRTMDEKRMAAFMGAHGRFIVTPLSDGHYFIRGEIPGKGGVNGVLSKGAYYVTKLVSYGAMAAAALKMGSDIRTDSETGRLIVEESTSHIVAAIVPASFNPAFSHLRDYALDIAAENMPSETAQLVVVGVSLAGQAAPPVTRTIEAIIEGTARAVETWVAALPWSW